LGLSLVIPKSSRSEIILLSVSQYVGSPVDTVDEFIVSIALRSSRRLGEINLDPHCMCLALKSPAVMKRLPNVSRKVIYCSLFITCLIGEYTAEIVMQPFHASVMTFVAYKKSL